MSNDSPALHHPRTRMTGRDIAEQDRASTPLELLFDLTFVIAFGTAADDLAHYLAEGHVRTALFGFTFTAFAISWAWINFSWFASAYDTDDWLFRVMTLVQMVGVLVLALGIHPVFRSIEEGQHLDNRVAVAGYVVMRVAMLGHWIRAWRSDRAHRPATLTYIVTIVIAQIGWVALIIANTDLRTTLVCFVILLLIEVSGPVVAETLKCGTPWHAHHIAERYGLVVIIALGEGMVGTMASLGAIIDTQGWSVDVAVLGFAGIALNFGIWWTYFVIPHGPILHARRSRSFTWGYGHVLIFAAVVAVGAGLHVAAYFLDGDSSLGPTASMLTVAVPVAVFITALYVGYAVFTRTVDPLHFAVVIVSAVFLVLPLWMASAGVSLPWCLLVLAVAPWVSVVAYETLGHRHNERVVAAL